MPIRFGLALMLLLFERLETALLAVEPSHPNVVIVLVDDAGFGDWACHGHPFLKTPNVDRLHRESIRFTDFHVAPMCSPTRGQLLTGCDGLRTGVTSVTAGRTFIRPEFKTAPELFSAAGYETGIFGKWHLGDSYPHRPMDRGFKKAIWTRGWGFTSAPEFSNTLVDGKILRGESAESFQGYITDFCFNEAMQWMKHQKLADRPFFCFLPLHAAHAPHIVPDQYAQPYSDQKQAAFFGMIANIDENMGRLDEFLSQERLKEDTVVVFLTDNGGTSGVSTYNAGLRAGKVTYYEGGHRVPCFVRWPKGGFSPPRDVAELTQVQDLLPTLLELCSITSDSTFKLDGVSLAPLLRDPMESLKDRTLVVQFGPGFGQKDNTGPKKFECCVLWKNWRLVNGSELYDVAHDRSQSENVAANHPLIVSSMRQAYEDYWSAVSSRLESFVPLTLGSPKENPVLLTASDWQGTYCDNARHIRNAEGGPQGGKWEILIENEGEYEFSLSRWPIELNAPIDGNIDPAGIAFPIAQGAVKVGETISSFTIEPGSIRAKVILRLPRGQTKLQAWFSDSNGIPLCGAFYVQANYLSTH